MEDASMILAAAASVGFIHTALGPDHYIPFVAMSKARRWSLRKTMLITLLGGMAHVGSSIVLGLAGLIIGTAVFHLKSIESLRGDVGAWILIILGLAYGTWGVRKALSSKKHTHEHSHVLFSHTHSHGHEGEHVHVHGEKANITPWILITVFALGPCEPLIPLFIYPAAEGKLALASLIALSFCLVTIATMLTFVATLSAGIAKIRLDWLEPWSHALAGFAIFLCGAGIMTLGL